MIYTDDIHTRKTWIAEIKTAQKLVQKTKMCQYVIWTYSQAVRM